jgi:hypothetical protein
MCYHTPCIGTVDDIEKIIDAGYANNLMLDWWCGGTKDSNPFEEDVMYLIPAIVGSEGKQAKFARTGKCSLLIDNKCSLHDKGLKPIQGRLACCKIERVFIEHGEEQDLDERIPVLHTWNTQRGLDLIERWKREVGFGKVKPATTPQDLSFPDMLEAMLSVMTAMDKMADPNGHDGRPPYDPNEKIEREIEIYEKPY